MKGFPLLQFLASSVARGKSGLDFVQSARFDSQTTAATQSCHSSIRSRDRGSSMEAARRLRTSLGDAPGNPVLQVVQRAITQHLPDRIGLNRLNRLNWLNRLAG